MYYVYLKNGETKKKHTHITYIIRQDKKKYFFMVSMHYLSREKKRNNSGAFLTDFFLHTRISFFFQFVIYMPYNNAT